MPTSFGSLSPCFKEIDPALQTNSDVFGNTVLDRRDFTFEDAFELHEMASRPPSQQELAVINSLFALKEVDDSEDE